MHFSAYFAVIGLLALGFGNAAPQKHTARVRRFNRFHLYAEFVGASGVTGDCPSPPNGASSIAYINQASTDTQARIFRDDKRKEIIFAAPGSVSAQDWQIDYDTQQKPYQCDGCAVHGGFLGAYNSIADQTHQIISEALNSNPDYKVITTGYSLGAAIAAFAWLDLKQKGIPVHALYTYGQPRLGNPAFANHVDALSGAGDHSAGGYFRIIHNADPVPNWPAEWDGAQAWRHPLTQYWEAGEEVQSADTTWRCYGQEPSDCSLSAQNAPNGNDHLLYSNVHFADSGKYCYL